MNEIEKMYELAGCKKILCDCTNCKKTDCTGDVDQDTCVKLTYSPFTAEKQLELIKWVAKNYGNIQILNNAARGFAIGIEGVSFNLKNFEEIIAMVLNTFWQDLTPEQKQQVKGILE